MTAAQHERARRIRERALIRAWEYRQRHHAAGVWFSLRRALVDAARAFIISEATADRLQQQGKQPLPVGLELSPAKRLFVLTLEELEPLAAREVPVRLTADLLRATAIVLLAFPTAGAASTSPEAGR